VVFKDLFHQLDTPVRRYIGQADNATVRGLIEKDENPEIRAYLRVGGGEVQEHDKR
jgi:hypothetical protein